MKHIKVEELVALAIDFSKEGIIWHHHLLTPKCALNKAGDYQLILENEESGDAFVCYFEKRPMKELKDLEDIFFKKD